MYGLGIVLLILLLIWLIGCWWILWQIWEQTVYCLGEQCYAFVSFVSKLNFAIMNALVLTWSLAPIVVTLALLPLLWVVVCRSYKALRISRKTKTRQ